MLDVPLGIIRNRPLNARIRMANSFWLKLCIPIQAFIIVSATAGPLFDTSTPVSFFTNVASRLLVNQLNVTLGRIEVYPKNQYTPAVHRLLQVTANIWDAQNTNFYPTVFRPLFSTDGSNVFIIGYQQVTNVSGATDPQLAPPYDSATLLNFAGTTPVADSNGPVNVYGIPWVIGAKQGLPNFNQLSLITAAQITRKLEVTRNSLDTTTATFGTNQMYIIGISNSVGCSFWNSYKSAYPRPVTVFASDTLCTTLTNGFYSWFQTTNFSANITLNSWAGSQWSGTPPNATPQGAAFLALNWALAFQNPLAYDQNTHLFDLGGNWQVTVPLLPQLDQFGLLTTNYLQAFILDGSNVIDYVQLRAPVSSGNLNQALADPDYIPPNNVYYQWSTNTSPLGPSAPYGILNQLWVSGHPGNAPAYGGQWSTAATPMGTVSPAAEAAYFNGFFTPAFQYNNQTYSNTQLVMDVPYTPSRNVYVSFLLQANDPLIHYLASDLNSQTGAFAAWSGKRVYQNGTWTHSDDPLNQPLPAPPITPLGGRYQPWGAAGQMFAMPATDTNVYNFALRDPLAWGSDYWNFPTGQNWSLSWLGQVHRGTPWQTIFLKPTNILDYTVNLGGQGMQNVGTNTWAAWTGDLQQDNLSGQYLDAANSAPITDWQLISLLAAMLNTNDLRTLFSMNNPDPDAWAVRLDGLVAFTNLMPVVVGSAIVPQLNPIVISSNSAQASIIANAIELIRESLPKQTFRNVGDVLAVPQLTMQSPFLNLSSTNPIGLVTQRYGTSDQAYEAIPSQLLPLLRADSIGQIISINGQMQVQFSGYDGHDYAVQVSSDLLNWTTVSTNSPVSGVINTPFPTTANPSSQFYRTVLIQ